MTEQNQTPQTCRWAQPPLSVPVPCWADAWDEPWICVRERRSRIIETSVECTTCPQWEERAAAHVSWTIAQVGL